MSQMLVFGVTLLLLCTGESFSPLNFMKKRLARLNSNPCDGQCTEFGQVCELDRRGKPLCLSLNESYQNCNEKRCNPVRVCQTIRKHLEPLKCICRTDCDAYPHLEVCGSDGITYRTHCHLHMTACRERTHIVVSTIGRCPHDVFYSMPPNVSIVLNASEIRPLIKIVDKTMPNMPQIRRLVQANLPRYLTSSDSFNFFNALRILTDTGYLKFEKFAVKYQAKVIKHIWKHMKPLKFNSPDARDAAVLDALDSLRWLPSSLFKKMWPGIPPVSTAFPHSFELPCKVEDAERVQWFHNDVQLGSVARHRHIIKDGSLWIQNVRPSDAGVYRCEVKTSTGVVLASSVVSITIMRGVAPSMSMEYSNIAFKRLNISHVKTNVSLVNVTVGNMSLVNVTSQNVSLFNSSIQQLWMNESFLTRLSLKNISIRNESWWRNVSCRTVTMYAVNASALRMSNVSLNNSRLRFVNFSTSWLENVTFWNTWAVDWTGLNWNEVNVSYWHSFFANFSAWNVSLTNVTRQNFTMINGSWWNITSWNETVEDSRWVNVSWWNASTFYWKARNWSERNTSYWNVTLVNYFAWNISVINSSRWNYSAINGSLWNSTMHNCSWINATWYNISAVNWTLGNWSEANVSYWNSIFKNFSAWNVSSWNVSRNNFTMINGSWANLISRNESVTNSSWLNVSWWKMFAFDWNVTNVIELNTSYWFTVHNNCTARNVSTVNVTRVNFLVVNSSMWNITSVNETQINGVVNKSLYCFVHTTNLKTRNFTFTHNEVGHWDLKASSLYLYRPLNIRYFNLNWTDTAITPLHFSHLLVKDPLVCVGRPYSVLEPPRWSGSGDVESGSGDAANNNLIAIDLEDDDDDIEFDDDIKGK